MCVMVMIIAAMVGALASHLGLMKAVGKVCARVLSCTKCATFWMSVVYCMYVCGFGFAETFCTSVVASYLSVWVEMFYVWLNRKYNELWEQILK